jgi:hypothetical protein
MIVDIKMIIYLKEALNFDHFSITHLQEALNLDSNKAMSKYNAYEFTVSFDFSRLIKISNESGCISDIYS